MADREKVIKGLECCTRYEVGKRLNNCLDCPYVEQIGFNQFRCKSQEMKEDALAILKQKKRWFYMIKDGKIRPLPVIVRCQDCKHGGIDSASSPHYWCNVHSEYHIANWFCADGERETDDGLVNK